MRPAALEELGTSKAEGEKPRRGPRSGEGRVAGSKPGEPPRESLDDEEEFREEEEGGGGGDSTEEAPALQAEESVPKKSNEDGDSFSFVELPPQPLLLLLPLLLLPPLLPLPSFSDPPVSTATILPVERSISGAPELPLEVLEILSSPSPSK